jgi:AcrR family transcriptional regulator
MAEQGKVDGRRARSRLTRARIVDAATRLFVDQGYLSATIEDVAEGAGVAVQTVYYVFGTKPNLLAAVLDASIAGDVEPVPVLERGWVEALRTEPDAAAAVERVVAAGVAILSRTTRIHEVVRGAAADPEVSALLENTRRHRRADQRELIEILWRSGHLRPDVEVETATDVFYGVMSEDVFQLFVGECHWTVERFRRWATTLLLQQLLGVSDANPDRPPSARRRYLE